MDARTFFDKVVLMRKAQKAYLQSHTANCLLRQNKLEAEIDNEIKRVTEIIGEEKQPQQTTMFNDQK